MSITFTNNFCLLQSSIMNVTVAGHNCINPRTNKNYTINCTVKSLMGSISGPVIVKYKSLITSKLKTIKSKTKFDFVIPNIEYYYPKCVSTRYDTLMHITGHFFNYTKHVIVEIEIDNKTQIPCEIISHSSNEISCLIGASYKPKIEKLNIFFNNRQFIYEYSDKYIKDPVIENGQTFSGIESGGIPLMLRGDDFSCIRNPKIYVDCNGTKISNECWLHNDSVKIITCQTPNLNGWSLSSMTILPLTFKVDTEENDNVVLNATDKINYLLYPDPTFMDFEINDPLITINGIFLYNDYKPEDIDIWFPNSTDKCNVHTVTKHSIICQMASPMSNLKSKDILIKIGKNLVESIERKPLTTLSSPSKLVNVLSSISIVFAFITLILSLLFCLKTILMNSKKQSEKRYIIQFRNITAGLDKK